MPEKALNAPDNILESNDALAIARQSVKSSVVLSSGYILQVVFAVAASLIIARLLGPEGYGVFSLTITLSILFAIFVDFGAIYAIQHNAAYYLARGELATARRMTKNAIIFTLLTGSGLSLASFLLASPLATFVLHRASLTPYVQISSPLILSQAVLTAVTLAFIGWRSPAYTTTLNIMQAALKLVLAPTLILLSFGVIGAITGHVLSYAVAATVGIILIFYAKLRTKKSAGQTVTATIPIASNDKVEANNGSSVESASRSQLQGSGFHLFISDVKEITSYGIPAYVGNGVYQFATASFVLFLLSAFVPDIAIGYYAAAYNAAQPILMVGNAIGLSLFAAFSSFDGLKADASTPFRHAVTYVSLVLMPMIMFAIGASRAIITTFYGSNYAPAATIFAYLALSYLPAALGLTIFPAFFNGIGRTRLTLAVQMASSTIVFTIAPLFEVFGFGISGVIYALILASIVAVVVGIYLARHYTHSRVDFRVVARIFVASDLSLIAIYLLGLVLGHLSHLETLALDFIIFFGLYLTLIPILRTISLDDYARIEASTSSLGFLKKPIRLLLRYEKYLVEKSSSRDTRKVELKTSV